MVYLLIGYLYGVKVMKIGLSQNRFWAGRSDSYKTSGTWPEIIGEIEGDHYIEQEIHNRFADSRIPGTEFFEYDERVEEIFKNGIFYRGKLYKPVIENYKEIHKQTSTFDLLNKVKFLVPDPTCGYYIPAMLRRQCFGSEFSDYNNSEYHSSSGIWNYNYACWDDFKPGYVYFDINDDKIQKIIYFRAPKNKKEVLYKFKDNNFNKDILGNEVLYWSNMCLNGFISFSNLQEVADIILDIKNKRYEYKGNPLYSIWCKNKKEGD